MSFTGSALNAPTITSAPSLVSNTPDKGIAPQFSSIPRIMCAAASWVCAAIIESSSETLNCWPRPVFSRCSSASSTPCTRCMPAE